MGDVQSVLSSLTALSAKEKLERWFPENLPTAPAELLKAREEACVAFCFEAVKTDDVHEQDKSPIKRLPRLPYLELWLRLMLSKTPLFAPKTRQMMMTWCTQAGLVWRILERPKVHVGYIAKKLEEGERHMENRIKGAIWRNLPKSVTDQFDVAEHKGALHLLSKKLPDGRRVVWDSKILAFPQGADQLRSETFSIIFWDEMAHQPGVEEAWKAVIPTIGSRGSARGQLIGISSVRRGSYFNTTLIEPWNFRRARNIVRFGHQGVAA